MENISLHNLYIKPAIKVDQVEAHRTFVQELLKSDECILGFIWEPDLFVVSNKRMFRVVPYSHESHLLGWDIWERPYDGLDQTVHYLVGGFLKGPDQIVIHSLDSGKLDFVLRRDFRSKDEFKAFRDTLQMAITKWKSEHINLRNSPSTENQTIGTQLKMLSDLFDSGALTEEEYDRAKKKIIDG